MANGKNLELALRIRADLQAGVKALDDLEQSVADVGDAAKTTDRELGRVTQGANTQATANERLMASESRLAQAIRQANDELSNRARLSASAPTAIAAPAIPTASSTPTRAAEPEIDAQTQRLRAMVAASLEASRAQDALTASTQQQVQVARTASTNWQENARAQTAAMNAYHNAERATRDKAEADRLAAEQAARAAVEEAKHQVALSRLLGSIDPAEKALARLKDQERELAEHFRAGRLQADAYASALDKIRARRDALNGIAPEAKRANLEMTSLAASIRAVQGAVLAGFAGFSVVSFSRQVVDTNLAWQRALYTMEAATGSSAKARQELEFVREISERLGLELLSTSQAYARLVAAAKETPSLGKSIHSIFEGVASATTALHLTREETNGILLALEQMVSKGKVQTQELVLQLGQRVPGAFALAAKALGTNTAQLSTWLEKGMIPASEFLPRFAAALQDAYGPAAQQAASGLNAEINRLTNAWTELKVQAGEAGFIDAFTQAVKNLRDVLTDPAVKDGLIQLITTLGKLIEKGTEGVGVAIGTVKWGAEEFAARLNGPAGDDPVRLDDAIQRETAYMDRIQKVLDEAYARGDQQAAARYEKALTAAQEQIQGWQQSLDRYYSGGVTQLPASTITAKAPELSKPFTPTADTKAAERLAKQNEDWVKQLEKEAATYNKGKAALREYELNQRNLTGALRARAEAAWATLDAAEKQKKADEQAKADTKLLAQLQVDYLKASGRNVEAAGAEIDKKYGALQTRLLAKGDTQGAGLISKLMGIEKAKAELDDLDTKINAIFSEQSRREQSIQAQQQAGLISELGARQQLVELNAQTAQQVQALLPKMQELAAATGDPAALERLKDLESQLGNLRTVANDLTNALTSGLENGLQNALEGLATGTMNLKEAATAFVQDISRSMAQLASQKIAASATDGLASLFGGGQQSPAAMAAQQIAAIQQVSMAQQAANTAMATSSVVSANTAAAGQATAAAATTTAWTPAALTASIGSFGAAAAIGLAALVAALAFKAFKDGGHVTGPGTGTSDSIPARLSNNEFVTRAAVVTQPGALGFLDDFNRRGMVALNDYGVARHSTGGLAGVPAPSYPAPVLPNGGQPADPSTNLSSTLKNNQTFILADDPNRILDSAYSDQGQERLLVMISRDPQKFRSVLNMGGS